MPQRLVDAETLHTLKVLKGCVRDASLVAAAAHVHRVNALEVLEGRHH